MEAEKIFLDIETVAGDVSQIPDEIEAKTGNLKDPAKIEAKNEAERQKWVDRAALKWVTGQVICIGWREEGSTVAATKALVDKNEKRLLQKFADMLSGADADRSGMTNDDLTQLLGPKTLVTFNGADFDLPYLLGRCWVHDVDCPALRDAAFQKPWEMDFHIDLANHLSRNGKMSLWKGGLRLDSWCRRAGIHVNDETSGSMIPDLWKKVEDGEMTFDEFADVCADHCRADVLKTEALYHSVKDHLLPPKKDRRQNWNPDQT